MRELRRQAGLRPESPSYQIGPDGVAKIELEPTTASGKATMRFALAGAHQKELHPWLEAQARDWILVGLTGGTLGYADVTDHMEELLPGEPDDGFGFDRGTSFFAKGRVKGEWLMTAVVRLAARLERVRRPVPPRARGRHRPEPVLHTVR